MENCKDGFRANEWCRICKGELCCQNNGCAYSPKDFEVLTFNYLWEKISRGNISIDHAFIGDDNLGAFVRYGGGFVLSLEKIMKKQGLLFLRARNVGAPIVDMIRFEDDPRTCVNWSPEYGCKLSFSERPKEGRLLEPKPFFECVSHTDPKKIALEWYEAGMQEILFHLAMEFSR